MNLDQRLLRDALGQFATGICVVTANIEGRAPLGMTVNSFSSVSLDPPLVLWSLQREGDCSAALKSVKHYGISVLSTGQQALSHHYAQRGCHDLLPEHYRIGKTGCPIIRGSMMSFECELWQQYDGGDHDIWVGRVLAMEAGSDTDPLIFYGGGYRRLR